MEHYAQYEQQLVGTSTTTRNELECFFFLLFLVQNLFHFKTLRFFTGIISEHLVRLFKVFFSQ